MSSYGKHPRQFYGTFDSCYPEEAAPRRDDSIARPRLTPSPAFDTGRSLSESYGQVSSFALQPTTSPVEVAPFQNVPLLTSLSYEAPPRMPFDDQAGPYLHVGSNPTPHVTSYRPSMGGRGAMMDVYVSSLYELAVSSLQTFSLMFGSHRCLATCAKIDQHGGVCEYVVSTTIPAFAATGSQIAQVRVYLLIESAEGELQSKSEVGFFTYREEGPVTSNLEAARKRKLSLESTEFLKMPAKRASSQQLRPKEELVPYGYVGSDEVPLSPYMQPSQQYGMLHQYSRSLGHYQSQPTLRGSHHHVSSLTASPTNVKVPSPQISSWSPYSMTGSSYITPSPSLATATASAQPTLSGVSSPLSANPPLIRTSTLQQSPSPSATPSTQQPSPAFNPYLHYPHKAVLKLAGDLDAMTEDWSVDEWAASRRLVLFKRSQSGCVINANFSAVSAEDRPPLSICVSCIYWEEKNECFVTSVDTIYLLESLIGARFTVEEKNRIRRNLEGFKPLTVSKAKADSEEFFKLIMAFPIPKPRNIEKDVKVFPWKILVHALRKIIGKYSASPSSTLPPALSTPAQSGYTTEASSAPTRGGERSNSNVSPRSTSRSLPGPSASPGYATGVTSQHALPASRMQLMALHHGGPSDLRFSTPNYTPRYDSSAGWQGTPQLPRVPYHQPAGAGHGPIRSSYDANSYLNTSPVLPAPSPAPAAPAAEEYGSDRPGLSGLSMAEMEREQYKRSTRRR